MQWLDIKDLNSLYPLDISQYAVSNKINEDPSFNWGVKDSLHTRDRIVSGVERLGVYVYDTGQCGSKNKYWRTTHKFYIEVPQTVQDYLETDRKTVTDLWVKYIRKDMKIFRITLQKLDGVMPEHIQTDKIKHGYNYFSTHMVLYLDRW